jgi:hypothetical protein
MKKIKIFKKEIEDGVAEAVKAQASIAYCSPAMLHTGSVDLVVGNVKSKRLINKIVAQNKDQNDLYYLESVLVSTGWNKNDDVFLAGPTWEARATPEDKQFNYMHDENDIIGHITGSYVLDANGSKVEADQQTPPDKFDIITQAVLYNSWTQDENKDRMEQIIAEIKDGKWFVSMECLFSGFDYALIDKSGNSQLVERNEASAFLTKHLRSYGGEGEYEGYKVGRALNKIAFSGKGLVRKPANPRSIILNSTAEFKTEEKVLYNFKQGEKQMALDKELDELKAQLAEAKQENQVIKAQIEEAKNKEFASKIEAFETQVSEKNEAIATLEEQVKSTQAKIAELQDSLTASQAELAEAMKQMDSMKKKAQCEKRKASLIEAGFEVSEADETLASFDALSDESFDSVVAVMKSKMTKKELQKHEKEETPEKEQKEEMKAEQVEATAEVFEKVESSEAALVVSEEVDALQKTKASIASWLEANVLSK